MAERTDLVGTSFHCVDTNTGRTETALILHDSHPGGLGYASTSFEHVDRVVSDALSLIDGCHCKDGCPACVGSYGRDRRLISWALHGLYTELPVPDDCLTGAVASRLAAHEKGKTALPKIPWDEVETRFFEVIARLREARVDGAEMLAKAGKASVRGHRLVITFASPGLVEWLRSESVQRRLWPAIAAVVIVPKDGAMMVEVEGGEAEKGLAKAIKLRRRHDDLTGGKPDDENAANDTLAGGYVLAKDVVKPN
jgi:DEAD/DEAH box helicase domain-containing protein